MNLVTGGTGLLGSHIVEQLCRRGRPVRALVRAGSDTRWLRTQPVELATGDLSDADSLARACQGVTCVYHAAARVGDWGPWPEFQEITINGTQRLVNAAVAAKVPRFIHISSVSSYGYVNGEGTVVDETAPLGRYLYRWAYYSKAKVAAEEIVWGAHKQGRIAVSVIRPSWIYGPRDRTTIGRQVAAIRAGKVKIIGDGKNRLNVVYAGNVAEGAILAADNERAIGQAYNCSDDGVLTLEGYYNAIADALGEPRPTSHIPYRVAYSAGFLLECWGHLVGQREPPFVARYSVWLMGRRSFFSADKARRDLGWTPTTTYDVGIPMTVKWYLEEESRRQKA
jgi:nucleoside-diphosphate-sugar epimerase